MSLPAISDADVAGKIVLVRADLNLPINAGVVGDRTRLTRFAPTVSDLLARGAGVVVTSHLGRPKGERNPVYSLAPVAAALAEELGCPVAFAPDCVGADAEAITRELKPGQVAMLENLRFHKGEERDDKSFAMMLSVHGDIYVNDAFSCAHRAHASTHAIAELMPAYAGPSLVAEVDALESALERPERKVAALVGGAKISSKIAVLSHIVGKVDYLIIGGGMANTFLAALGHPVGRSLCETDAIPLAREVLDTAKAAGCTVVLPEDVAVSAEFSAEASPVYVSAEAIPADMMALDIGPKSEARIATILADCRTLLWNGPLGAFEMAPFAHGTVAVARAAAELTAAGRLVSIAGGGDTGAALATAGVADRFTYLSTAGGAFLEWLEGKELPGIKALMAQNPARAHQLEDL